MTLSEMIDRAISLKDGNKEFILLFDGERWFAEIGNPSPFVVLGEISGEIRGEADSYQKAMEQLLLALEQFE